MIPVVVDVVGTGRYRQAMVATSETRPPYEVKDGSQAALIIEVAAARGILTQLGPRERVDLAHEGRTSWFRTGHTPLNTRLAKQVVTQKEVTSRLLRHRGIPAPDNAVFTDERRAWSWAESALPVVLKPTSTNKGTLVHMDIGDRSSFTEAFERILDRYGQVLVEEQLSGEEHRFSVIKGDVVAVTRRVPMHVVGDAQRTVNELIQEKNAERGRTGNPIHKPLIVDDEVRRTLAAASVTLDDVPDAAETVWLRRTSNISIGGDAIDATDHVDPRHIELVKRAARAISGLRVAGFDVLIDGDDATILEVNAAPMLTMHHYPWLGQPRDAMGRLLDAMFPATTGLA